MRIYIIWKFDSLLPVHICSFLTMHGNDVENFILVPEVISSPLKYFIVTFLSDNQLQALSAKRFCFTRLELLCDTVIKKKNWRILLFGTTDVLIVVDISIYIVFTKKKFIFYDWLQLINFPLNECDKILHSIFKPLIHLFSRNGGNLRMLCSRKMLSSSRNSNA